MDGENALRLPGMASVTGRSHTTRSCRSGRGWKPLPWAAPRTGVHPEGWSQKHLRGDRRLAAAPLGALSPGLWGWGSLDCGWEGLTVTAAHGYHQPGDHSSGRTRRTRPVPWARAGLRSLHPLYLASLAHFPLPPFIPLVLAGSSSLCSSCRLTSSGCQSVPEAVCAAPFGPRAACGRVDESPRKTFLSQSQPSRVSFRPQGRAHTFRCSLLLRKFSCVGP